MRIIPIAAALVAFVTASSAPRATGPRFYPDDPLWRHADTQDASAAKPVEVDAVYDMVENLFARPGDGAAEVPARNVNTVGEVPDSSWFTNRAGRAALEPADIARAAARTSGPAAGPWTVISAKSDGVMPGFVIRDAAGVVWFVKFDPPGHPGLASGAEVISTRLLWALGYHVPQNEIAAITREQLVLAAEATVRTPSGKRAMRASDLSAILRRAHRDAGDVYRAVASRRIDGTPLGGFRFHGTRSDDPNDYVPHEHRRELRGYRVFAAWLNHVDSKSMNTFDALVKDGGRSVVRHYLLDFGSALGSAALEAREPFEGDEYLYEGQRALAGLLSLGLRIEPWRTVRLARSPAIGALRADHRDWDPDDWKPRYPNPAFVRATAEDKFWAARKLQAITPALIGAAVASARYADAADAEMVTRYLVDRRRAILARYLPAINPIVEPSLDLEGALEFVNAAVAADVAAIPSRYRAEWSRFDNATNGHAPLGEGDSRTTMLQSPAALPSEAGAYISVAISAVGGQDAWARPVRLYFRRDPDRWTWVGLER